MAETVMPYQHATTDSAPFLYEISPITEATITPVDFRPNLTHEQITRRIGEVAAFLWQHDDGYGLLSCEPIASEHTENQTSVTFRVFWRGYESGTQSIPHANGWSGEESTGLYTVTYDIESGQFDTGFIPPLSHRYHVSAIEARKRTDTYEQEMAALRRDLWGDPEA